MPWVNDKLNWIAEGGHLVSAMNIESGCFK